MYYVTVSFSCSFLEQMKRVELQNNEENYSDFLDRLKVADFLYTEFSLEEVIYQLAKVMFTQSLVRESSEAQQALQKFTSFLESEANKGYISKTLEKKVLGKFLRLRKKIM